MACDRYKFVSVDPSSEEAHRVLARYFAELDARFETGFDAAGAFESDEHTFAEANSWLVLLRDGDKTVGCGAVARIDAATAEIKRMWIDGGHRGAGLGRKMLAHLERVAGDEGYHRVVLDTNSALTEAISMYESAGFRAIERYNDNPYAHRWFEKVLSPRSASDR